MSESPRATNDEQSAMSDPRESIGRINYVELGLAGGILAGLSFLIAECLITLVLGGSFSSPLRLPASIVLGPAALGHFYPASRAVPVGVGIDLFLSASFGLAWVLAVSRVRRAWTRPLALVPLGLVYGSALWLLGNLVLGAIAFPQVAVADLRWNGLIGHAVFFGGALATAAHFLRSDVPGE